MSSNFVHIMEVGPRDGLQIEDKVLSVGERVALINSLADAGLREIEVGSFVNYDRVPQMADTDKVLDQLDLDEEVRLRALWFGRKGLEEALGHKNLHVEGGISLAASDTFSKKNLGRTSDEILAGIDRAVASMDGLGVKCERLGIMAAFGCNFEGEVPLDRVLKLIDNAIEKLAGLGAQVKNLTVADTMGWATPAQVKKMADALKTRLPDVEIKLHFHDTRGMGIANCVAAIETDIRKFDASIGGLGGCPFGGVKGAAGNVCTEELVFLCDRWGLETGIDLGKLLASASLAEKLVERTLPSKLKTGGLLPSKQSNQGRESNAE